MSAVAEIQARLHEWLKMAATRDVSGRAIYERTTRALEEAYQAGIQAARDRVAELEALIDTPHTGEFFESIRLEAAHQAKRWGSDHDAGKAATDWFWLVGYLLGKAINKPDKLKHHLVSSGAALLNWYRQVTGDSSAMRPGIEEPSDG